MDMAQVMAEKSFVIVGDTLNEQKFACKIKNAMVENGYRVQCVGKELQSINDTEGEIDIIDLCIRPDKGLELLKECKVNYKGVVLQPGTESDEIKAYLESISVPFLEGCLLVGLRKYR